jgi:hypothetical protein
MRLRVEFSRLRNWSDTVDGLAHGWHGPAWAWSHMVRAGFVHGSGRTWDAIVGRLQRTSFDSTDPHIGVLVGTASAPVLAASLARVDACLAPLSRVLSRRWMESMPPQASTDAMSGAAGAVLAAAEIETNLPGSLRSTEVRTLLRTCERNLEQLTRRAEQQPVVLGFAHGVAGYLLALECGDIIFGRSWSEELRDATMCLLFESRIPVRPGHCAAVWPYFSSDAALNAHGWCNGGPGIALALLCAHTLTSRRIYRGVLDQALRGISVFRNSHPSICCGMFGHLNILVEAYRLTAAPAWLASARTLSRGLRRPTVPLNVRRSLWKGPYGCDYTTWRLAHPMALRFPGVGAFSAH